MAAPDRRSLASPRLTSSDGVIQIRWAQGWYARAVDVLYAGAPIARLFRHDGNAAALALEVAEVIALYDNAQTGLPYVLTDLNWEA